MKAGITGLPYSGKTTLFCALTGQDYGVLAHGREGDHARSQFVHGVVTDHELRYVGKEETHPLPESDPPSRQAPGQPVDPGMQLAVSDTLPFEDK